MFGKMKIIKELKVSMMLARILTLQTCQQLGLYWYWWICNPFNSSPIAFCFDLNSLSKCWCLLETNWLFHCCWLMDECSWACQQHQNLIGSVLCSFHHSIFIMMLGEAAQPWKHFPLIGTNSSIAKGTTDHPLQHSITERGSYKDHKFCSQSAIYELIQGWRPLLVRTFCQVSSM